MSTKRLRLCFRTVGDEQTRTVHDNPNPEAQPGDGDDETGEPTHKRTRFELGDSSKDSSWDLPENLHEYVHRYMREHVSGKDIKEGIMGENPVLSKKESTGA